MRRLMIGGVILLLPSRLLVRMHRNSRRAVARHVVHRDCESDAPRRRRRYLDRACRLWKLKVSPCVEMACSPHWCCPHGEDMQMLTQADVKVEGVQRILKLFQTSSEALRKCPVIQQV